MTQALPIILVSAGESAAANKLVSDITDGSEWTDDGSCRVWHLVNKYYEASVRLIPHIDNTPLVINRRLVEAHVIHLTEAECVDEQMAAWRAQSAGLGGLRDAVDVRLVAAEGRAGEALRAWARRRQYELVPMPPPPRPPHDEQALHGDAQAEGDGDGQAGGDGNGQGSGNKDDSDSDELWPEEVGVPRLREALHAHPWSSLTRLSPVPGYDALGLRLSHPRDETGEQFAAALALLQAAAALPPDERRAQSGHMVGALSRALADSLDDL